MSQIFTHFAFCYVLQRFTHFFFSILEHDAHHICLLLLTPFYFTIASLFLTLPFPFISPTFSISLVLMKTKLSNSL